MKNSKFISKKGLPLLFTIVLFICTISCKKEKLEGPLSELPPSTQEGAHTFGCLINGKPWVAHLDPGVFTPSLRKITSNYSEPLGIPVDFSFRLVTTRLSYSDSTDQSFKFLFQPIEKNGKVDIDRLNQNEITFHTSKADGLGKRYQILLCRHVVSNKSGNNSNKYRIQLYIWSF
ncbi:MAG: hypothetical protein R2769_04640 [Saprospiraceae bacterium]